LQLLWSCLTFQGLAMKFCDRLEHSVPSRVEVGVDETLQPLSEGASSTAAPAVTARATAGLCLVSTTPATTLATV
jgi:hypothetical protein